MSVNEIKGIGIVGEIFTGKTSLSNVIATSLEGSYVVDKSTYLTYIPIKLGYEFGGVLQNTSLDEFVSHIKNSENMNITKEFKDSLSRSRTINFSRMLREKYASEHPDYNLRILEPFITKPGFPIIAGIRYLETFDTLADNGFVFFGLTLDNYDEIKKRAELMHNHSWEDVDYQLKLEREAFDTQKILADRRIIGIYETSTNPHEFISKDIISYINRGAQDAKKP